MTDVAGTALFATGADGLEMLVIGFFLLFARTGAILLLLPVFSEDAVPGQIRVLIAVGMTAALWGLLGAPALEAAHQPGFPVLLVGEALTGLAIGSIVKILYLAISMAGSIVSMQSGLSAAAMFDPAQGGQVPQLSRFMGVAAAILCMAAGVHHLWIGAIIRSYRVFPIGGMPPAADFARLAVDTVGQSMTLAVGLAAPMLIYGIVFNVALGLAARVAPAIQIFFIAQPLNLLLGLALAAITMGAMLTGFADAMATAMQAMWGSA